MLYFHTLMFARWRFLQRCVRTVSSTFYALVDRACARSTAHFTHLLTVRMRTVSSTF